MFWLLLLALMILIPVVAGVQIWRELGRETAESPANVSDLAAGGAGQ